MANDFIKYAFSAGEISPQLFGRSDLEQYDLGLAQAKNWFVDFRGGIRTRPGFAFCEFVKSDTQATKFFGFSFSPRLANTYAIMFGHNYIRFIQDGAYVLEDELDVTNITAAGVVTSAGHGYSNGDWVKFRSIGGITDINGRTLVVTDATTNTFKLKKLPKLGEYDPVGSFTSAGKVARVYEIASPYSGDELAELRLKQHRDLVRMTHPDHVIKNLIRNDHTDWDIENEVIGVAQNPPSGLGVVSTDSGDAGVIFSVTAVLEDDSETVMAKPDRLTGAANPSTSTETYTYSWDVHSKAVSYNVYRSNIVALGTELTLGAPLGFIGNVVGNSLADSNITPDFSKTPPINYNPFAPGSVETITVTAPGSGYDNSVSVSVSGGGGSGFRGFAIVNSDGTIGGVKILERGSGYSTPVVSFTGGGGSGATATAEVSDQNGTYPSVSARFQQRQLYAASDKKPLTIWGSQVNEYSVFDYSEITVASDSYEFEVDSEEIAPIRHMIPLRGGLVLMSQVGVWQLTGGAETSVTPLNALADPQTYTGVSLVEPLQIGTSLLYIEGKGYNVRQLTYNEYSKVYGGEDKSILSRHLFNRELHLTSWAHAPTPNKHVLGVQHDGGMLAFTIVPEEKLYAWTPWKTRGLFQDCVSVYEAGYDNLYVVVKRYVNGRWTKFIERLAQRDFPDLESAFCVDCGLSRELNYPDAEITFAAASGEDVRVDSDVAIFDAGDVGRIIYAGGGKAEVIEFVTSTRIKVQILTPLTNLLPEAEEPTPLPVVSGEWSLNSPVSEVSGLWHLEDESVSALLDGNAFHDLLVVDGTVTFPEGVTATKVTIGLKYTCIAQTMPPVVSDTPIEHRRKRVVAVSAKVYESKGLKIGPKITRLREVKERTIENYDQATKLFTGQQTTFVDPEWDSNGQTILVQDNPLPATVLGVVLSVEVGDDDD